MHFHGYTFQLASNHITVDLVDSTAATLTPRCSRRRSITRPPAELMILGQHGNGSLHLHCWGSACQTPTILVTSPDSNISQNSGLAAQAQDLDSRGLRRQPVLPFLRPVMQSGKIFWNNVAAPCIQLFNRMHPCSRRGKVGKVRKENQSRLLFSAPQYEVAWGGLSWKVHQADTSCMVFHDLWLHTLTSSQPSCIGSSLGGGQTCTYYSSGSNQPGWLNKKTNILALNYLYDPSESISCRIHSHTPYA